MRNQRRTNTGPALGLKILERDNYRCAYCGDYAGCVDHIVPVSRGGTNDDENLVAACYPCNGKKSNKIDMDMMARAFYVVAANTGALRTPIENAPERPQEALEATGSVDAENRPESRPHPPKFQVPARCWLGMDGCPHIRYTSHYDVAQRWLEEYRSGLPREACA